MLKKDFGKINHRKLQKTSCKNLYDLSNHAIKCSMLIALMCHSYLQKIKSCKFRALFFLKK